MSHQFKLQDPGEGIHEVEIHEVLVSVGDIVKEGQDVLVVESDKAAIEIPAPENGKIEKINVSEGDIVTVGDVLMEIGDETQDAKADDDDKKEKSTKTGKNKQPAETSKDKDEDDAPESQGKAGKATEEKEKPTRKAESAKAPKKQTSRPEQEPEQETDEPDGVKAVPAARKLAKDKGIDLAKVKGTGSEGQITRSDILLAASESTERENWEECVPLRSVRRATARHMARAWAEIPHVTHQEKIDITELETFRQQLVDDFGETAPKLTLTAFVLKALALVLPRYPRLNASLDMDKEEISLKRYYDFAVAVDTDRGLVTPVLKAVDRHSIMEIAAMLEDTAEKARARSLKKDALTGGTFTLTNIGGLGGSSFTPIINHPQCAILGMAAARREPVVSEGGKGEEITIRLMLPLILAFDHRLVDGAEAARFMNDLRARLSRPARMLAELQ
ncbi:dihydrolipoamide acetyltransferase family protein [Pseudokordiimonas caeni]|uniref:dihydrolipoamide acetyltransferase family protein n=1 Tax=Pseudokordiimonas caeni TaxID=2997908 RepID=UPI002811AD60|nr:dihydrolipoamide acetyltransferase family protein [Pseudokordiimonas caeni]